MFIDYSFSPLASLLLDDLVITVLLNSHCFHCVLYHHNVLILLFSQSGAIVLSPSSTFLFLDCTGVDLCDSQYKIILIYFVLGFCAAALVPLLALSFLLPSI